MTASLFLDNFNDLVYTPDDVEFLNRTILTLAVQGKLTKQDPNDPPASEFIERAYLDDVRPQNTAESLMELPKGWAKKKLGEICIIARGGSPRPIKKYITDDPDGINWIKIGDTKNSTKYVTATEEKITPDGAKFSRMVFEGDFILSNSMSFGRPYIMKTTGCIHDGWLVLQDIDPKISHDYLYYVLSSDVVFSQFDQLAAGSTVRNLNSALVRGVAIPIPPLAEQQRIVARVEELFAQTSALAKELDHSQIELDGLNKSALSHLLASKTPEEFNQHWDFIAEHFDLLFQAPEYVAPLRQSILELAVRGKLTRQEAGDESAKELLESIRANIDNIVEDGKKRKIDVMPPVSEDEKQFELPDGWEWARIGDIAYGYRGHNPVKDEFIYKPKDGYIRFVQITDFKTEERAVYVPNSPQNKMIYKGEIIMAAYRHIGKLSREMEGAFNVALCKVMELPPMSRDYLEKIIGTSFVKGELLKASGRAHIPSMHLDHFMSLVIPLPPLAEQERIVKRVEQLLSLCDALEARLQSAEEERGMLVAAVMSTVGG